MNRDTWVNRCREKITSRFSLAQAAVLRWEQLLRGARPRIPTEHPKGMETPLRELATGAVRLDPETYQLDLVGTPYEPPRPEPDQEEIDLLGGMGDDTDFLETRALAGDADDELIEEVPAEGAGTNTEDAA